MEDKLNIQLIKTHKICKGEQRIYLHYSTVLNCEMKFSIFLPREALRDNKCPVLYFLAGLGCNEQTAIVKSGFQRFAHRYDMIVVCPDTSPRGENITDSEDISLGQGAGFYINATQEPWNKNYKMEEYILNELPQIIEKEFPTNNKKSITGHSMGGFGALVLGLNNIDDFCSISAFAPICSPENSKQGKLVLKEYLGNNQQQWDSVNPCEIIKKVKLNNKFLPILIDVGTVDEYLETDLHPEILDNICKEIGYHCEINYRKDYDHGYYFVQSYIREHFVFHAEYLDAN